ncbi:Epidermal retinol dehydrogenase 2, partial [Merops nubicus]
FRSILKILQFLKLLIFYFFEQLILFIFPLRKKSFAGEIVLITGSANGIGRQIALKFAPSGATLVLWDIDDENNQETKRLAEQNGAKRVFAYHCDCSNREDVYKQADKVREEVGDVTILINNAGILLGKKFLDIPDADFEKTLRTNFFSQVWTCKAFLPAMMTYNHGHLVSTDNYSASKFAIMGMMEAIDWELCCAGKHGVKITIVCPYFVHTALAKGFQSQYPLLLPVYDPDYVASRIMDAIQKDKFYLMMPPTLRFVGLKNLIPRKILLLFTSCLKVADSLDKAFGQK